MEKDTRAAPPRSLLRDATWALGQLRHLYSQMIGGGVHFPSEAARGLLAPAIALLEPLIDQGNADASPPPDSSAALLEARKMLSEQELKELERALRAASPPSWTVAFSNTTIRPEIHAPLPVGGTPSDAYALRVAALTTSEDAAAIAALRNSASSLIGDSRALLEARRLLQETQEWIDPHMDAGLLGRIRAFLRSDSEKSEHGKDDDGPAAGSPETPPRQRGT